MLASLLRPVLGGLLVAALALPPSIAAGAPSISGADGEVWNARTAPARYVITGRPPDHSLLRWQLYQDGAPVSGFAGSGPSPATATLDGAPDGRLTLVASQTAPGEREEATRTFTIDTTPPGIGIARPVAGAVYQSGRPVLADFSCDQAATCEGTVGHGSPIDTSTAGTKVFAVIATDAAGNTAQQRVEYRVAPPPAATIRRAPPPPGVPRGTAPPVRNADRLRPAPGTRLTVRRPVLRWTAVRGARLYNVQIYRLGDARAT